MLNTPKTFLLAFVAATATLCLALWLKSFDKTQTVTATVMSNTVTQSLDGHRRYLTVESKELGIKRVTVPISVHCPEGALVTLNQVEDAFFKQSLTFFSCK